MKNKKKKKKKVTGTTKLITRIGQQHLFLPQLSYQKPDKTHVEPN